MRKLLLKRSLSFFSKLKSYSTICLGFKLLISERMRALVKNLTKKVFLTFILFGLLGTITAFGVHALPSIEPLQQPRGELNGGMRGDTETWSWGSWRSWERQRRNSQFSIPKQPTTNNQQQITNLLNNSTKLVDSWKQLKFGQKRAAIFAKQGDIINQALVLSHLCLAYQQLGQWEEAEAAISQSLSLLNNNQKLTTQHQFILAQVLNNQGNLQLAQNLAEQALRTWQEAEAAYAGAGDQVGIIGTQLNQAKALQTLGLYRRAKTILETVEQTLANQSDSPLKAAGLLNLGNTLRLVGDLDNSQQVLEQSLAVARASQSPPDIQAALLSLGNIARAQENPAVALEFYQQAVAVCKGKEEGEQVQLDPGTAQAVCLSKLQAQLNQFSLLVETEQWSVAQALLPQIQSQLANLPTTQIAVYGRIKLAESLMQLPAGFSSSAQLLATAVQQAQTLGDPRAQSYALGNLGKLYEQSQQWFEAENLTRQALAIAQGISAQDIMYQWQWQLGRILCRNTEPCTTTRKNFISAITAYTEAVKTLASIRSDLVAHQS